MPQPGSAATPDGAGQDEGMLLEQIRVALTSAPRKAEIMIREASRRFPTSERAEMRDMMLIIALYNQAKNDDARAEARGYFGRYPNGRYTEDIASLLHISAGPTGNPR